MERGLHTDSGHPLDQLAHGGVLCHDGRGPSPERWSLPPPQAHRSLHGPPTGQGDILGGRPLLLFLHGASTSTISASSHGPGTSPASPLGGNPTSTQSSLEAPWRDISSLVPPWTEFHSF